MKRERKTLQIRGTTELKLGGWRVLFYFPANMVVSCLWAHRVILLWDKDHYSFPRVIWLKWKADEEDLSSAISSHSIQDGCLIGKMNWG